MSYERNEECTFTKVFFPGTEEEKASIPANAIPDIPENAADDEIKEAVRREVCSRSSCHLNVGALALYMMGRGEAEIAEQVPSDCSWHEVSHVL